MRVAVVAVGAALILGSPVGCSRFGADDASVDASADATTVDGGAGEAGDALGPQPSACAHELLCDDFEGVFPSPVWSGPTVQKAGKDLRVVVDPLRAGHVLEATLLASTGDARATLDGDLSALTGQPTLTVSASVRAVTPASAFTGGYVVAMLLACGDVRAIGVLYDGRGFTLQLDSDNGEYQGFAKDTAWHTIEVTRSTTTSSVTIDGQMQKAGAGYTATATGNCHLLAGAFTNTGVTTPAVAIHIDDVHVK